MNVGDGEEKLDSNFGKRNTFKYGIAHLQRASRTYDVCKMNCKLLFAMCKLYLQRLQRKMELFWDNI